MPFEPLITHILTQNASLRQSGWALPTLTGRSVKAIPAKRETERVSVVVNVNAAQADRNWRLPTQAVAVLGVEAGVVDEVHAAANHVARRERGSVRLAGAGGAEGVAVVSVVTVWVLVPTWRVWRVTMRRRAAAEAASERRAALESNTRAQQ